MEVKVPTIDHVREAIKIAKAGGKKYGGFFSEKIKYKQNSWCGTSCCVWGHAMLLAGNQQVLNSVSDSLTPTLRAKQDFGKVSDQNKALGVMMSCSSEEVLPILSELAKENSPLEKILQQAKESKSIDDNVSSKAARTLEYLKTKEN